MQYHSFTIIWVHIFFLFRPFRGSFFLSKYNGFFSPLPLSTIDFSIGLINLVIAHECDMLFGSLSSSSIQSQAFVFSPFGGWKGGSIPLGGLPEWEFNTYHHSSSIACTQGASCERECFTNALIYIRPTPKPPQIRRC